MVTKNLEPGTWNLERFPRGLTLLELVAVMAILAIMATIAVRSLDLQQDQAKFDATQRQLAQIQTAVLGDPSASPTSSSAVASGFVSDLGRPPLALADSNGVLEPLELWSNPNGLPAFQLRQAVTSPANIQNAHTVNVAADGTTTLTATTPMTDPSNAPTVFVSTGWRGPYLTNMQGITMLLDGWGNTFKLFQSDGATAVASGGVIQQFQSLGADNAPGGDGFNTDLPPVVFINTVMPYSTASPQENFRVTITINVILTSTTYVIQPTDSLTVRLYGPDASTGLVTYFEQAKPTTSNPSPISTTTSFFFKGKADDANGTTISTSGARVLRASLTTSTAPTTPIFSNVLNVVVPAHGTPVYTLTINN